MERNKEKVPLHGDHAEALVYSNNKFTIQTQVSQF